MYIEYCRISVVHVLYRIALTETSHRTYTQWLWYVWTYQLHTIFSHERFLTTEKSYRVPSQLQTHSRIFEHCLNSYFVYLFKQIDFREDFSSFMYVSWHQLVSKYQIRIIKYFCIIQKRPASEGISFYFKFEAYKLLICIWYLVTL